jgi:hypothetical protein
MESATKTFNEPGTGKHPLAMATLMLLKTPKRPGLLKMPEYAWDVNIILHFESWRQTCSSESGGALLAHRVSLLSPVSMSHMDTSLLP